MWNSEIADKKQGAGFWTVNVRFVSSTASFNELMNVTKLAELEGRVRGRLSELNGATGIDTLALGAFTPPTIAEPTQAELDKTNWFRDFGRLEKVQELIDLQVLTGNETQVVNLRNRVATNFKAAYINDM